MPNGKYESIKAIKANRNENFVNVPSCSSMHVITIFMQTVSNESGPSHGICSYMFAVCFWFNQKCLVFAFSNIYYWLHATNCGSIAKYMRFVAKLQFQFMNI